MEEISENDWSCVFKELLSIKNIEDWEQSLCFTFYFLIRDENRQILLKEHSMSLLIERKLIENIIKKKGSCDKFNELFGFNLICFIGKKMPKDFSKIFDFDLTNIFDVLIKKLVDFSEAQQFKFIVELSNLIEKMAANKQKIANFLYKNLLKIYFEHFSEFELRSLIASQIGLLFKTYKKIKKNDLINFYIDELQVIGYPIIFTENEIDIFAYCQTDIIEKDIIRVSQFYHYLFTSGSFWQIAFWSENYADFVVKFWLQKKSENHKFVQMWNLILKILAEMTCKIFQNKEFEKNMILNKEANNYLLLFARLVSLDYEYFRNVFREKVIELTRFIVDFISSKKTIIKSDILSQNYYFKVICLIMDFDNSVEFDKAFAKKEENLVKTLAVKSAKNNFNRKTKTDFLKKNEPTNNNVVKSSSFEKKDEKGCFSVKCDKNQTVIEKFNQENTKLNCFSKFRKSCEEFDYQDDYFMDNNKNEPKIDKMKEKSRKRAKSLIKWFRRFKMKFEEKSNKKKSQIESKNNRNTQIQKYSQNQVELKLQLHGRTLSTGPLYNQLKNKDIEKSDGMKGLQKNKKVKRILYKNVFNILALRSEELAALQNNYKLHKNLFLNLFRRFSAENQKIFTDTKASFQLESDAKINAHQFYELVKFISPDFDLLSIKPIVNIFKYVNYCLTNCSFKSNNVSFQYFEFVLYQFSHYFYNINQLFVGPVLAFQMFLKKIQEKFMNLGFFENDFILSIKCDQEVLNFLTKQIKKNEKFELPNGFQEIERTVYQTEEEKSPFLKESRKICLSLIFDLISEKLDFFMKTEKITKLKIKVIKQVVPIQSEMNPNCQFCIQKRIKSKESGFLIKNEQNQPLEKSSFLMNDTKKDYKNGNNPIQIGFSSKLNQSNFVFHSTNCHFTAKLSLPIKLAILQDTKNCRKNVLEVGSVLEEILNKVVSLNEDRLIIPALNAKTINPFQQTLIEKSEKQKNEENKQKIEFEIRKLEAKKKTDEYRKIKQEKQMQKDEIEKENKKVQKDLIKQKIKEIEQKRNEMLQFNKEQSKREQEQQIINNAANMIKEKEKILKLKKFQSEYQKKILDNASISGLEKIKIHKNDKNDKNEIISRKTSAVKIKSDYNLIKLNELYAKNVNFPIELEAKISCCFLNPKWKEFAHKWENRITDVFFKYSLLNFDKNEKNIEKRAEENGSWNYNQFCCFCKDIKICPDLLSIGKMKNLYYLATNFSTNKNSYSIMSMEFTVIYSCVVFEWEQNHFVVDEKNLDLCLDRSILMIKRLYKGKFGERFAMESDSNIRISSQKKEKIRN